MKEDALPPPSEAFQETPIAADVIAIEDSDCIEERNEKSSKRRNKSILCFLVCALAVIGAVLGIVLGKKGGDNGKGNDITSKSTPKQEEAIVVSANFVQRLETMSGEILTMDEQKAFCRVIENNAVMALEDEEDVEAICDVLDQTLVSGLDRRRRRSLRNSGLRRELDGEFIEVLYSLEFSMDAPVDVVDGDGLDGDALLDLFEDHMNDNLVKVTDDLNSAGVSVENISKTEIATDSSKPTDSPTKTTTNPPTKTPTDSLTESSASNDGGTPTTESSADSSTDESPTTKPPTGVDVQTDGEGTVFELSDTTAVYRSADGAPFAVQMAQYNSNVVEGYSSCVDLRDDILTAARIKANAVIEQQTKNGMMNIMPMLDVTASQQEGTEAATENKQEDATAAEDSEADSEGFETNNQVDGVHEADVIKSNGEEIYAAYGDKVVVLDVRGDILSEITMPQLENLGDCKSDGIIKPLVKNQEENEVTEESTEEEETLVAEPKSIALPYPGNSKPKVRSLLLHDKRLTVVVESWRNWCSSDNQPILSDYGRTHIRLYDISDPKNLKLVGTRNLQGSYREARRIDEHAHFVSVTNVNTWAITGQLYRWRSEYQGLNDTEYFNKATEIAANATVNFADRLVEEMEVNELDCSRMARISMMETGNRTDGGNDVGSSYANGIINGYAQVTTVDMQHDHGSSTSDFGGENTTLLAHVSGLFLRTSWVEVYASKSVLVLFGTGYRWNFRSSTQTTYLCAFRLGGGTARPTAIGTVPGDLLDQFSIDHEGDYLRVASTEFGPWGWFNITDDDGNPSRRWMRQTNNRITVLEFPDENVDSDAYNKSILSEVGFIDGLGEPGERIFAVRYVDDMAYVVTFRQTDPFYVIDMSNETNPTRVGELKISGFSNYIHSVDDDTLLAVGQETNEDGRPIGLQLSMFDVSDPSTPTLLTRYTVEEDDDNWSWSDAQFEHKAFRYLSSLQKLILPARISGENDFDGFLVFGVSKTDIEPEFNITHTRSFGWCHYDAYLQARSIVVDGKVTTFKGHTVKNHNLIAGNESWVVDLDENLTKEDCYWGN